MAYYLGIDGGGTKTTCAVGDELRLLAMATAGPSNIVRVGESRARESLHQCVGQACAATGIAPGRIAQTCVGGAGAARPELAAIVRNILAEILPTPVEVVGDMEIALEAAFGAGPGVIVIAGTGSIAYGRDAQGRTARAGGWGFAVSDEGSAHSIGRDVARAILRAADAAGETPEARAALEKRPDIALVLNAWGVTTVADFARSANSTPPPDFAALFPAVVACLDDSAAGLLGQAGKELAYLAEIVIRRSFAKDVVASVPVAMTGGVFRHASVVRQVFYNELRQSDARVEINRQVVDPVEGALNMARRAAGLNVGTAASAVRRAQPGP